MSEQYEAGIDEEVQEALLLSGRLRERHRAPEADHAEHVAALEDDKSTGTETEAERQVTLQSKARQTERLAIQRRRCAQPKGKVLRKVQRFDVVRDAQYVETEDDRH